MRHWSFVCSMEVEDFDQSTAKIKTQIPVLLGDGISMFGNIEKEI